MDIGKRIRELREERGLSQREVARRAGLTPSGVGFIELGQTQQPSAKTVVAIARALNVPVEELLADAPVPAGKAEARPGPGEELRRILEREFGDAYLLAELDDLRSKAAKDDLRSVDVLYMMVELGDEVQFLREVFLHLPHYFLDRPKGANAEVTQEEAALLRGVGQAIQDAWRGARPRAYILAAEATEKERLRAPSNAALRRFTERLDRDLARVGQEVDTALSGA